MEYLNRTFKVQNQPNGGYAVHRVIAFDGTDIFSEVTYPDLVDVPSETCQMPLAQFVEQIVSAGVEI